MAALKSKLADTYYKHTMINMLSKSYPLLSVQEINEALDFYIEESGKDLDTTLYNNYKENTLQSSLSEMTEYILSRKPIVTPSGCLFQRHADSENPYTKLIDKFIQLRTKYKAEMFKYPKGSKDFEKYNLLQLLAKIDANGIYGASGMPACIYFNIHVAASITAQGRSAISASILAFEAFLADNVKFNNLDEIIVFIDNITNESDRRHYIDEDVIDRQITVEDVMRRLFMNCNYDYPPTDEDMEIVWDILIQLPLQDLNRLYYKNNLYDFVDNSYPSAFVTKILQKMEWPYLDPNEVPEEIDYELKEFWNLLKEWVYYPYQYLDKIPRVNKMFRSSSIIIDTDSVIVSLDAWYRMILGKITNVPMRIKTEVVDPVTFIKEDEFGDRPFRDVVKMVEPQTDYDFISDKIIEVDRMIDPVKIVPKDGVRFSIINIMAYCLSNMINDYMVEFTKNTHSYDPARKCLLKLKNEFTFRRLLLMPNAKKHYADIQELQEGNRVPESKSLAISGLELDKSGLQMSTRKRLKKILYEDILKTDTISQIKIVKELAKFEKEIYQTLESGSKQYYKPVKVKSMYSYDSPMSIQGIKASVAYNELRDEGTEAIDLSIRNSIDIAKVNINKKNIDKIMELYPETYQKLLKLLGRKEFSTGVSSIAIPMNTDTPGWMIPFIAYDEIISANLSQFPLDPLAINKSNTGMYTNLINL